jgi:endonuclease III
MCDMNDHVWIDSVLKILKDQIKNTPEPMTREIIFLYGRDPYLVLISCLLSLQNRDTVTLPVSKKLFEVAATPEQMVTLGRSDLESIIKSVNYFKTKAQRIQDISQTLLDHFGGQVPPTLNELMALKGIGLKTANLVMAEGFGIPAICVDTHVHRLSNHWGMVHTKTPQQTEVALRALLPKKYWIEWNYLLVKWGQSVCKTKRCGIEACAQIQKLVKTAPGSGVPHLKSY